MREADGTIADASHISHSQLNVHFDLRLSPAFAAAADKQRVLVGQSEDDVAPGGESRSQKRYGIIRGEPQR